MAWPDVTVCDGVYRTGDAAEVVAARLRGFAEAVRQLDEHEVDNRY